MKSIFEIENRLDIIKEFTKFVEVFHKSEDAVYNINKYEYMTFVEAIDESAFLKWNYRDTFLSAYEYLEHIGIKKQLILYQNYYYIEKENFLLYIEFIFNMFVLLEKDKRFKMSALTIAAIKNIPIILEKMNYKINKINDNKYMITKRNSDVDSVLESVPKTIATRLLEYNDFRIKDNLEEKKKILKAIDLYIEEHKEIKQQIEKTLDDSIGIIVNKMGVNHPIKEELYKSFTENQLIEWYDKCFLMMIHAIRTVEINKIKNERKELVNN